jgi:hypothetical protein
MAWTNHVDGSNGANMKVTNIEERRDMLNLASKTVAKSSGFSIA